MEDEVFDFHKVDDMGTLEVSQTLLAWRFCTFGVLEHLDFLPEIILTMLFYKTPFLSSTNLSLSSCFNLLREHQYPSKLSCSSKSRKETNALSECSIGNTIWYSYTTV